MSLSVISRFGQFTKYSTTSRHVFSRSPAILNCKFLSTEAAPLPDTGKANIYSEKIVKIVDQIGQLNLLEVADLNKLLKEKFNISDAPVMMTGNFTGGAAAAPAKEEEEEQAPVAVQTSFTLKLDAFDAGKKVALIKEIKNNIEGMNLVQAKKFVESAPAVVKTDLSKEEAEKLKTVLEAAGGTCKID